MIFVWSTNRRTCGFGPRSSSVYLSLVVSALVFCSLFSFDTLSKVYGPWVEGKDDEPPFIMAVSPSHAAICIRLDDDVAIRFSEPMDKDSVRVMFDPPLEREKYWLNDSFVDLEAPDLFRENTTYLVNVTGTDLAGNPLWEPPWGNRWMFSTICSPYVWTTDPVNGSVDVPRDYPLTIVFDDAVDPGRISWDITPFVDLDGNWSSDFENLTLTPVAPYEELTLYHVTILLDGQLMASFVPNPWEFITDSASPHVLSTDPSDKEKGVILEKPIKIVLSESMDTTTINWSIDPPIDLVPSWSAENSILTLNHNDSFAECSEYVMQLTGQDLEGLQLVPSPFVFSFTAICENPYIVSIDPSDGMANVSIDSSIMIVFSEPMNTSTIRWTIYPSVDLSFVWSERNTTFILQPVLPLQACGGYNLTVTGGEDSAGLPLLGVPYSTNFTTECNCPPPMNQDKPS